MVPTLAFLACSSAIIAQVAPVPSIATNAKSRYIGNCVDYRITLDISDDNAKTWKYTCEHRDACHAALHGTTVLEGTYELDGDLAVFTRHDEAFRFATNFAKPKGEVQFNAFFPSGDDSLRYRRRWYLKSPKGWRPLEEHVISMPRTLPTIDPKEAASTASNKPAAIWAIPFKAERIRWDDDGMKTIEAIDMSVTYKRARFSNFFEPVNPPVSWLPKQLMEYVIDQRLQWVWIELGPINDIAGFFSGPHEPPK